MYILICMQLSLKLNTFFMKYSELPLIELNKKHGLPKKINQTRSSTEHYIKGS